MIHSGRRIIPARAGFTTACNRAGAWRRDHPRSRGVYTRSSVSKSMREGSSPLARGLQQPRMGPRGRRRIIPARAGFTWRRRAACYCAADHPRSRGVYPGRLRPSSTRSGSSPLARGLLNNRHKKAIARRIIPARAGFTAPRRRPGPWSSDHPRSRGVYIITGSRPNPDAGSSPLARGLRLAEYEPIHADGIIPARAGFTRPGGRRRGRSRDHPRSRGVYSFGPSAGVPFFGSSPLARGLLLKTLVRYREVRIIPTRAGFTDFVSRLMSSEEDHPRSRGVYSCRGRDSMTVGGSSPLARGLRIVEEVRETDPGIIPARAGFTDPRDRGADQEADHPRSRGVYGRRATV